MHKKLIPNIIITLILIILMAHPAKAKTEFTDIQDSDWYSEHVNNLSALGIINGFPDGTFRADEILNTDQFIKMIITALGNDPGNGTNYWASKFIECAERKGLLENIEINDYKKPLPRGEIACIISKALDTLNENIEIEACELYDLYGYTPAKYVSHVLKTYNAGIMTGYPDNTFRYDKYITRAEACAVIHKLVTPITRREHPITSFTPVPVCYSYIKDDFTKTINEYEGNHGCFVADGDIFNDCISLQTKFNPAINRNIIDSMKLLYDGIAFPEFKFIPLAQNNMIRMDVFTNKKLSHDNAYSMFTVKIYDAPTGYVETDWGYDTMFMKIEINRLSSEGLLNKETKLPDIYYEYKIRSLMRLIFGIGEGDVFSKHILDKYIEYAEYKAGEIPQAAEILSRGNTQMVFFCEGSDRQLCFTFSRRK